MKLFKVAVVAIVLAVIVFSCNKQNKPNKMKVANAVSQTLDGQFWAVADHKGKTILIDFWSLHNGHGQWQEWLVKMHKQFKHRNDFVMVSVTRDSNAKKVKEYCEKNGIEWTVLQEPRTNKKAGLSKVFNIKFTPQVWMLNKDGEIKEVYHPGGQLEAELVGITYESFNWVMSKLSKDYSKNMRDKEYVLRYCGTPDEKESKDGGEVWHYARMDALKTAERKVQISFDSKGKVTGYSSQHRLLDPANVEISVSEEGLKNKIKAYIPVDLLPDNNPEYSIVISAQKGMSSYPFFNHRKETLQADKIYKRQMVAGEYSIIAELIRKEDYHIEKKILLTPKVVFEKNEKVELEY